MPERNSCSWNAMLAAWTRHGSAKEFNQLFSQMMQEGIIGDRLTFISKLSVCTSQRALLDGKRLHASTVGSSFEMDTAFQSSLISFYASSQVDVNSTPTEYFERMQLEGVLPDEVTFSTMFTTCSSESIVHMGIFLHALFTSSLHEPDILAQTAIITMYGNCGRIEDAQRMFKQVSKKDTAVWNAMITAYSQIGSVKASISLFCNMLTENQTPNKVTFLALLTVCSNEAVLTLGNWIFEHIVLCNLELDLEIGNSLLNMYGRCGSLEDALEVFSQMPEHNLVSWSSLIILYMQHDFNEEALQLFNQMIAAGIKPDKVIFLCILPVCESAAAITQGNEMHHCIVCEHFDSCAVCKTALLNMYSNCGSIQDAQRLFDSSLTRNTVSWSSLVAMHAHHGDAVQAIGSFNKMVEQGLIPDAFTFCSMLSSCSHAGLLEEGLWWFICMVQRHFIMASVEHYNCIVDLFGRAGQLDTVEVLLKNMGMPPSSSSWMTMSGAYRMHLARKGGQNPAVQATDTNLEDISSLVQLSSMLG